MTQPEVQIWYDKLFPPEIKRCCPTYLRLSHEETLAHFAMARVMMAPSLSDGIPNTMTEAMALGAAPLVSPLDTIVPVVREGENVLFARNLYPDEIAAALVRLMTDDALVDRLAANNLVRIRELADRDAVRARAIAYYEEVAALARRGSLAARPGRRGKFSTLDPAAADRLLRE
ncbi:MAG: glycosyltransferase, partial [Stellaceae bacterium]